MSIFRARALAAALVLAVGAPAVAANAGAVTQFDLPVQPLADALRAIGDQTNTNIFFDPKLVAGRSAPALKASLSVDEALSKLLRGTGLTPKFVDEKTIMLVGAGSADSQEAPLRLNRVRVAESDTARANAGADESNRAAAAAAGDSGGAAGSDTGKFEEVLVTARRREEKSQTVPIAITAVSQQRIADNNVRTLSDLQYLVPSMSAVSVNSREDLFLAIRGQGKNPVGLDGVITYINEVPISRAGGPGLLFDLENVQVLKGPQGTLFGRNSVGGALVLQTARPKDHFESSIEVGFGNYNNQEINALLNVPLVSDKLAARFAFTSQKRDGFSFIQSTPEAPNGVWADDRNNWSMRGSLSFKPNGRVQNDTIASYNYYTDNGSPLFLTHVGPGFLTTVWPFHYDAQALQAQLGARKHIPISTNLGIKGINLYIENVTRIDLTDTLTLRNIFGFQNTKLRTPSDNDATTLQILDFHRQRVGLEPRDTYTEELQLLGKAFDGRLDWIAGGFLLDSPTSPFSNYGGVIFYADSEQWFKSSERSEAVYAQGTYDLGSLKQGLSVTAGLRHTSDSSFRCGIVGAAGIEPACLNPVRPDSSAVTWTLGLNYQVTPETLTYLTSRRGYRAGGANGYDTAGNILPSFGPEYVTDLELGLKSDWSVGDVLLRTNAALFYQDYTEMQVQQYFTTPNGFAAINANAGAARLWGTELELTAQLTRDLQVGVNFSSIDFKYTEFGENVDLLQLQYVKNGNRPPYKYGVDARYRLPLADDKGNATMQATWNWQDDSGSLGQALGSYVPAFGLLNLNVNWDGILGGPFDASIYASNVLDKLHTTGGYGNIVLFGAVIERFGEPRMYGVRVRYNFGK